MGKTKRPMMESHSAHDENKTPHDGFPAATGRIKTRGDRQGNKQMTPKFMTAKGPGTSASAPYYIGHVQHDRAMSRRESYEYLSQETGFRPAQLRAAFLGFGKSLAANAARGNSTTIDGVANVRNVVKGSFETVHGPWVPGVNMILLNAFGKEPFKGAISGFVPVNRTEGAKPVINTVFDETTRVYDEITGTDLFSIAGSDLAPDETKEDEYVAVANAQGVETKCEIEFSDIQNVKAHLASALPAGQYTLKVYTRSGLGDEFGVKCATRRVTIA